MATPASARPFLDDAERRTIDRLIERLHEALGEELVAVWLYGSRARGERSGPESDVDMLVLTRSGAAEHQRLVSELLLEIAPDEGARSAYFAVRVVSPDWVRGRREIRSFFMQEVDRDKIVLAGER